MHINTVGVSAGRMTWFRVLSYPDSAFPQFKLLYGPVSIPGSSTEKLQVRDLEVPEMRATSRSTHLVGALPDL
jgi:hypothetical protein